MQFLRRSLTGLFLLATTVGLLAYAGWSVQSAVQEVAGTERGQRPARERVFAVNAVTVEPGTITPVLSVFGEVQSRRTLDVRPATGGRVQALAEGFEDGGRVAAGQLLLQIDPADAETRVALARADLADAQAEAREADRGLALAQDDLAAARDQADLRDRALARQRDLVGRGVGTEAAVEAAELAASSARQAVLARRGAQQQAEARVDTAAIRAERAAITLAEAERALGDTRVVAPFAGTLTDVAIVEGGLVGPNERVARIVDPDALEVAVRVSTPQYARLIGPGGDLRDAAVTAELDVLGVDLVAQGRIVRESAAVGEGQTGRLLFAALDAAPGFRPGDFVEVLVEEPPLRGVARLPSTALSAAGQVLVIGEEDRLTEAPVDLVRRQGDDVLVRAPALAGRQVVAERSPLLGPGIRVRALDPAAPGMAEAPSEPETIALDPERRARLIAFVEGNGRMPAEAKARVLGQLERPEVPAAMVARLEGRMGS
ncbi:MAG: efflux RND transporter periplasmic adaptor subunit [Shimia sp.]